VLIVSSLLAVVSNVVPQAKPVKQKADDPTVHTGRAEEPVPIVPLLASYDS
jgi:hypothetical protein